MELTWGGLIFWIAAWTAVLLMSAYVVIRLIQARDTSISARDSKTKKDRKRNL